MELDKLLARQCDQETELQEIQKLDLHDIEARLRKAKQRDKEIAELDLDSWNLNNLTEKLGPVPATMIANARKGIVKICQNFDGEHVDLAIVDKTIELVGTENMLMMTDSIESKYLAGRQLYKDNDSELLYQEHGLVAAGSQGIERQICNMIKLGLSKYQIKQLICDTPNKILPVLQPSMGAENDDKINCI